MLVTFEIRVVRPAVLWATLVCLISVAAFAETPSQGAYRSKLLEYIEAGEADSARVLVEQERLRSRAVVDYLLAGYVGARAGNRLESAVQISRRARVVAELHAAAFGDSVCLRHVSSYEALPDSQLATELVAWERFLEARRLHESSRWLEAQEILPEVVQLVGQVGDPYLEQRAEALSGYCKHVLGHYEDARGPYERALVISRRIGDPAREARLLANIALTYQAQDRLAETLESFRGVAQSARQSGDWELYVGALDAIGTQFDALGDLDSAQVYYTDGLAVARERGIPAREALILGNLGRICEARGDFPQACTYQRESLQILQDLPQYRRNQLASLIGLSTALSGLGEYSNSLAVLREALPLADRLGIADGSAYVRNRIGELYLLLDRPAEALRHHREVLPRVRELGIPRHEAETLRLIARAQEGTGRLDEAVHSLEEALRVVESGANLPAVVGALHDLGRLLIRHGEPARATALLLRAVSLADSLGNPILLGNAERTLGRACARRGEEERALALFDQAIQRGRTIRSQSLLAEALVDKAAFLRRQERLAAADSLLAEAIEVVESVRGLQRGDEIRIGVLAAKKQVYVDRVAVLCELGRTDPLAHEEAFRVAEKARARALLDVLSGVRVAPGGDIDPSLSEREDYLLSRLRTLQVQISRAVSADAWEATRVDSLQALLQETAREYRTTTEEIATRSPAYGAAAGWRRPLAVVEVQERVLEEGQVLLEYLTGRDESFAFVVADDWFRVVRIPVTEAGLTLRVRELRDALGVGGGSEAAAEDEAAVVALAQELHALLLAPVANELRGARRLLIVPDGPLFYLPFGALHDGAEFLVQQHAIACAPSASVLDPALSPGRPARERRLLAVANPASFRSEALLPALRDATGWRFVPLPHAEEEMRRVSRFFTNATLLTGASATEESLKAVIGRASHVHFATHGLLNEAEPILSGLSLAQDEDPREDGVLQVHEIVKLDLAADLVVLSACNTGLGRVVDGEGLMGLARSFLYAGARSLLLSLWELGDRPTVDLMERFYRAHLADRLPLDEALREAQVASITAGRPLREWAPLVIVGRVAEPGAGAGNVGRTVTLLAAVALVTLVLIVRLRRRA